MESAESLEKPYSTFEILQANISHAFPSELSLKPNWTNFKDNFAWEVKSGCMGTITTSTSTLYRNQSKVENGQGRRKWNSVMGTPML